MPGAIVDRRVLRLQLQQVVGVVLGLDVSCLVDGKRQVPVGERTAIGQSKLLEDVFYSLLASRLNGAWCGGAETATYGVKAGARWLGEAGGAAARLAKDLLLIIEICTVV